MGQGTTQTLLGGQPEQEDIHDCAMSFKEVNKPTLVLAHNKTLAGQLYGGVEEFFQLMRRILFRDKCYDYYPARGIRSASDTYIEGIERQRWRSSKLRHSATSASHKNVVIAV